jgi:hypothetical protein
MANYRGKTKCRPPLRFLAPDADTQSAYPFPTQKDNATGAGDTATEVPSQLTAALHK